MGKLQPSIPPIVEEIDYLALKEEIKKYLIEEKGILEEYVESESYAVIIEAYVYDEMRLRSRINASTKATMLLSSEKDDLDFKAKDYDVERLDGEEDDAFRERCRLSLYRQSTAGGRGSYKFWTMSVSPYIKQVKVLNKGYGVVEVVFYNTGEVDLKPAIDAVLADDDIRPVNDAPFSTQAIVNNVAINITLWELEGYSKADVRLAILQAIDDFNLEIGIGVGIPLSKIYDIAHVEGVFKITIDLEDDIDSDDYTVVQIEAIVGYGS